MISKPNEAAHQHEHEADLDQGRPATAKPPGIPIPERRVRRARLKRTKRTGGARIAHRMAWLDNAVASIELHRSNGSAGGGSEQATHTSEHQIIWRRTTREVGRWALHSAHRAGRWRAIRGSAGRRSHDYRCPARTMQVNARPITARCKKRARRALTAGARGQ